MTFYMTSSRCLLRKSFVGSLGRNDFRIIQSISLCASFEPRRVYSSHDSVVSTTASLSLLHHPLSQQCPLPHYFQIRWKHSGRMGHKLDMLDEMAHRPEREAAQERRQKNKDRKAAKKTGKSQQQEAAATEVVDDPEDDDFWSEEGNEEEEESKLPDPDEVKKRMMAVVQKFQESLKSIRGAEPTPEMFDDVQVNAYGSTTPLKAVGQVVIVSPTLAQITCFDPTVAKDVQKAVQLALGLNPQQEEGGMVKVPLPRVSMEVREQTAKQLQKKAETCKQRLRQVRRKAMDVVKKGKDGKLDGISKDDAFGCGKEIEAVTDTVMEELKAIVDEKIDSIMAV